MLDIFLESESTFLNILQAKNEKQTRTDPALYVSVLQHKAIYTDEIDVYSKAYYILLNREVWKRVPAKHGYKYYIKMLEHLNTVFNIDELSTR